MVFPCFSLVFADARWSAPPCPCFEEVSKDLQVRQRRAELGRPAGGRRCGEQRAHDQRDEHHRQRVVQIGFDGLGADGRMGGWEDGMMGMGS